MEYIYESNNVDPNSNGLLVISLYISLKLLIYNYLTIRFSPNHYFRLLSLFYYVYTFFSIIYLLMNGKIVNSECCYRARIT